MRTDIRGVDRYGTYSYQSGIVVTKGPLTEEDGLGIYDSTGADRI